MAVGVVTGDESRQTLYTMLTRGRHANHVHVVVAGDGDPHQLTLPETTNPSTATEILDGILARDGAAVSATSSARTAARPEHQLRDAAARYGDAVVASAEQLAGSERMTQLDDLAETLVPGIADTEAWPALRAQLVMIDADGHDAAHALTDAIRSRDLSDANDPAAVLMWRLDGHAPRSAGPLPWLPALPHLLEGDPQWGRYVEARAERVVALSDEIRARSAGHDLPDWAEPLGCQLSPELLADLVVWRAANGVDSSDRRPAGPPPAGDTVAATYFRDLTRRINDGHDPALVRWGQQIDAHLHHRDDFVPQLAERLDRLQRHGKDVDHLLDVAAEQGPLPDDYASAALWHRILDQLGPAKPARPADDGAAERLRAAQRIEPPTMSRRPSPGIER